MLLSTHLSTIGLYVRINEESGVKNMDENVVAVSHVLTEVDADCAIAALSDAGINAAKQYINAPGGSTLLAFPSAMGFGASEGYDILVVREALKEAREVLIGAGFAEPEEELSEKSSEDTVSENTETSENKEVTENTAAQASENPRKASVLLMILFLAAAALFVIGVDKVIDLIKSFF